MTPALELMAQTGATCPRIGLQGQPQGGQRAGRATCLPNGQSQPRGSALAGHARGGRDRRTAGHRRCGSGRRLHTRFGLRSARACAAGESSRDDSHREGKSRSNSITAKRRLSAKTQHRHGVRHAGGGNGLGLGGILPHVQGAHAHPRVWTQRPDGRASKAAISRGAITGRRRSTSVNCRCHFTRPPDGRGRSCSDPL